MKRIDRNNLIAALIVILLFALAIMFVPLAHAAGVTLSWDLNSDNPSGYKAYFGRYSGNAKAMPNAAVVTVAQPPVFIPIPDPTGTWFFRVTAYEGVMESTFSNMVKVKWLQVPKNVKLQSVEVR